MSKDHSVEILVVFLLGTVAGLCQVLLNGSVYLGLFRGCCSRRLLLLGFFLRLCFKSLLFSLLSGSLSFSSLPGCFGLCMLLLLLAARFFLSCVVVHHWLLLNNRLVMLRRCDICQAPRADRVQRTVRVPFALEVHHRV